MMSNSQSRFGFFTILIIGALAVRFMPHAVGFSPLLAICMFGGAHYQNKAAGLLIPLAGIWLTDILLNNFIYAQYMNGFTLFYQGFYFQYAAFLLTGLLAVGLFNKKITLLRIAGGALGAGVLFYLVSNFGVWATGTMYPPTWSGLVACYAAGLPFLKSSLVANAIFSTVLFGAVYLAQTQRRYLRPVRKAYGI